MQLKNTQKDRMNLVVVGEIDHGKSTLLGRLLADTDSLPVGRLEELKAKCQAAGKEFEYSWLLDALTDEQEQGITIDAARVFFETAKRHYIIIDTPGHAEFLKNMVTGASSAEAAVLVLDAAEGVQENSRRHAHMLSLLGVEQVLVVINKMDAVGYEEAIFRKREKEFRDFLKPLGLTPSNYIPLSALKGENVAAPSSKMSWYEGHSLVESLDLLQPLAANVKETLRLYIQDSYSFKNTIAKEIFAGTLLSGKLEVGDELLFSPSAETATIQSLEAFPEKEKSIVHAGEAVGFTLSEAIEISRGELASLVAQQAPKSSNRIKVSLFWLGQEAMLPSKEYIFKIGSLKLKAQLEHITKVIDSGNLGLLVSQEDIERNCVAECVLALDGVGSFDEVSFFSETARFVLVDEHRIAGGGIIKEAL